MADWLRFLSPSDDSDDRETLAATRAVPGVRVEVQGLNKFFGPKHVLRDLTLTVEPGETFVIFGPSGCGKSVLLKHITGLMSPDAGRILVDGIDIREMDLGDLRARFSLVLQDVQLFSGTIASNGVHHASRMSLTLVFPRERVPASAACHATSRLMGSSIVTQMRRDSDAGDGRSQAA